MYTQARDKKMLAEAQQMLEDARTKIEIVRMQMLRVQQADKQNQQKLNQQNSSQDAGGDSNGDVSDFPRLLYRQTYTGLIVLVSSTNIQYFLLAWDLQ